MSLVKLEQFTLNSDIHHYDTRNRINIRVQQFRFTGSQNIFCICQSHSRLFLYMPVTLYIVSVYSSCTLDCFCICQSHSILFLYMPVTLYIVLPTKLNHYILLFYKINLKLWYLLSLGCWYNVNDSFQTDWTQHS